MTVLNADSHSACTCVRKVASIPLPGSQGPCKLRACNRTFFYSRSYAKDVTSVTSGASQGPHSFNSVFVCLFVPSACLALSRTCSVPYHQRQPARHQYGVAWYKDVIQHVVQQYDANVGGTSDRLGTMNITTVLL